jgi:uroporphyrinogen-III synthase
LVEKASVILQRNMQLSAEDASSVMQRESRARRQSMMRIAEAILIVDEIERKAAPC